MVEPADHAEAQPFHDLRDQLAVAMFADQDVHLGPVPVIGRKERDLVEERVDIALAGACGRPRGRQTGPCTENGIEVRPELPDEGGRGRPDRLDHERVLDFHAAATSPCPWRSLNQESRKPRMLCTGIAERAGSVAELRAREARSDDVAGTTAGARHAGYLCGWVRASVRLHAR